MYKRLFKQNIYVLIINSSEMKNQNILLNAGKILAIPFAAAVIMSCKGEQTPPVQERDVESVDSATGIITLRDYQLSDTVTIGGKLYNYTYSLQHVDSMGVVINPQGLEYKESKVSILVKREDTKIFEKTYFKNDFKEFVPKEELSTYTMVGVNYNFTKKDDSSAIYFIVTVGDPDETSDMAYPLELKINSDGSSSFSKALNLETEPIHPGMNVDPSDNAEI